ncbi:hypothetical protein [Cumulibacter manganitolerans]|uniref:hypothetical protein n=1 Tax=Cumulibacter manganitolerans TaxID=1884992 RepID=UPI001297C3B6|nr:hypothetical protein [Cumulibacter manganitolerans]
MRLYAATPVRRTRQIAGDLLLVGWVVLWIWLGNVVHDATMSLTTPGQQIDASATGLSKALNDAGDKLEGVPVVGDEVATPFNAARDAADGIADAGRNTADAVATLAFWLGLLIAAIPIVIWAAYYLPRRYRFARRASAGQRFIDSNADLDLFALRALATQPMHVLARIDDDPAGRWRAKDPEIIRALGELELKESGLRPPRSARVR